MTSILNSILGLVGLVRIPRNIGRWTVRGGHLVRTSRQIGWRIVRKRNALGSDATELDYFLEPRSRG